MVSANARGRKLRFNLWFRALDVGSKIFLVSAAAILAIPLALTVAVVPVAMVDAAIGGPRPEAPPLSLIDAPRESTPTPIAPVERVANLTVVEEVPFAAITVDDATMAAGTTAITTVGVAGTIERVFSVTYLDRVEASRVLVSETVTVPAIDQVTSIGTYVAPPPPPAPLAGNCDANYADGCVPVSSDVDCAGGSGNGPAYVSGIVRVVGSDIYDLDRDGDGYGCD